MIIKLCDRVHNMRTGDAWPEQKRRDKALETMEVYAPIAHRLGLNIIQEELEDRSLRFLDPVGYQEIRSMLEKNGGAQQFLDRIAKQIEEMTGAETRICVPGHMQRGGSPSAYDRVLATQFGTYAAGLVADEHYGVTVAMVNNRVTANPLAEIAGKTRGVPDDCDMMNVARSMGISLG